MHLSVYVPHPESETPGFPSCIPRRRGHTPVMRFMAHTGGRASGKSTVCRLLREALSPVVIFDSDAAVLPANLLQAQRDFFGAHTYERTDKPRGQMFHTDWPEVIG